MARDQVAVLRDDEIGLDIVRTEFDAERVRLQRVFGQIAAAAAAVADDERAQRTAVSLAVAVSVVASIRERGAGRQGKRLGEAQAAQKVSGEVLHWCCLL
jgi:hypothetical protein